MVYTECKGLSLKAEGPEIVFHKKNGKHVSENENKHAVISKSDACMLKL